MKQSILLHNMRELRNTFNYTQADVSQLLNIQRQTYCNYENASRNPPLEIIIALADLYHVSVDYLVRGIPTPPPDASFASLSATEKKVLNDFSTMNERNQKEVMNFIQFKKQYPS